MPRSRFAPAWSRLIWGRVAVLLLLAGCSQGDVTTSKPPSATLHQTTPAPITSPASPQLAGSLPAQVVPATLPMESDPQIVQIASESKPAADVPNLSASKADAIVLSKQSNAEVVPIGSATARKLQPETAQDPSSQVGRKSVRRKPSEPLITTLMRAFVPASDSNSVVNMEPKSATKDSYRRIKVNATVGWLSLQTFCVNHEGQLVALLGTSRYANEKSKPSEVQILSPQGAVIKEWKLSFSAQSINIGPDHLIYVAGDGKVAKYDNEGKELALMSLPHIDEMVGNNDKMRKDAEELLKKQQESYNKSILSLEKQLERLKKDKTPEQLKSAAAKISMLESQIQAYQQIGGDKSSRKIDEVVEQLLTRLRIINSIAISDQDVFLVCGDNKGYGYNLWRTDLGFHDPKLVINNLRGCCGQMDVQIAGSDIIVAQNTEHKFGRYDREGKLIGKFGKQGRGSDPACFGGCCNPMNVRAAPNGDVFTSESEGIIKRFSSTGEFKSEVGKCSLTGGCKNVAVAVSPDSKHVYFCDQPGSQIVVLELPPSEVAGAN